MPDKVKRTRLEKLMDARIATKRPCPAPYGQIYHQVTELIKGVDYLFFEVDLLIREVEELKAKKRSKAK